MTLTGNNVITLGKLTSKVTAEKGLPPSFNNLEDHIKGFGKVVTAVAPFYFSLMSI